MSKFHVSYEGVEALCVGLARDLDNFAVTKGIDHHFVEVLCHEFLRERGDGSHDIFVGVTVPTGRAGVGRLCIRFSGAFDADVTLAAKDRYGLRSH